jgi:hypothetical protein
MEEGERLSRVVVSCKKNAKMGGGEELPRAARNFRNERNERV